MQLRERSVERYLIRCGLCRLHRLCPLKDAAPELECSLCVPRISNSCLFLFVHFICPKNFLNCSSQLLISTLRQMKTYVQCLQALCHDAPNFTMLNFNCCSMTKCLNHFYQHITYPTRQDKVLDHYYGTIKGLRRSQCE